MPSVYKITLKYLLFFLLLTKYINASESKNITVLFTPIVIPDIISFKAAFEYRLHKKINLVIPLETKIINYRTLIKLVAKKGDKNFPEDLYKPGNLIKPGWNLDYSHKKIATGVGVKIIPFGTDKIESDFFIKGIFLVGFERFDAFSAEGIRDSVFLGSALTLGYNWVVSSFICGLELGAEYDYHTNPINNLPRFWMGFSPLFQFSLGFII